MSDYKLVLASASPRRSDILKNIGLTPVIQIADIDETPRKGENPPNYVMRLSYEKVMEVACSSEDALIIGGDTVVVLDEAILQKPVDEKEAMEMLRQLRNKRHQVLTGISIYDMKTDGSYTGLSVTEVEMADYSDEMIRSYIATGEPMDKAGAYGIQGVGAILVKEVCGDYNTVVGLPVSTLIEGFKQLNIDFFDLQ